MTPTAILFICLGLLIVSVAGGYLIWCFWVFENARLEFNQAADVLERSASDCLAAFDDCNFRPDSKKALACLIEKHHKEACIPRLEKEYKTVEMQFQRLSRFALPGMQGRLLQCHERLIRLEWAMDACNFPTVCNRIAGWIPDDELRLRHVYKPLEINE